MHALVEDLLPYLVVFYLVDSLVLVRASEWALLAPWRGFRLERSGLHLAGLSPLAETVGVFVPPLLGRDGVVLVEASVTPPEARFLPYEAIGAVAVDGSAVRIGDRRVFTPAPAAARRLAAAVRSLRDGKVAERPARLDHALGGKADLERARQRRGLQARFGRVLRGLGLALFLATFGLLPASVAVEGAPGPAAALLVVLGLDMAVVALSWRMLRRCGRSRADAAAVVAPMALFPPSAIHAASHLSRDLYVDLDPLAAAAAVLDGEAFRAVARRLVQRAELLRGLGAEAAAGAGAQLTAWRELLAAAGTSLEQVLEAPASPDPSAALYCPLCAGEYRAGFSTCSDCGVSLRALAT